jgi:hypothetical protein
MSRPWPIDKENYERCVKGLFPQWLKERGGVVVYENHMMDSSQRGVLAFMPARFVATDNLMHDAPPRIGDVPSRFQERVDTVRLEEFAGELDKALACFKEES